MSIEIKVPSVGESINEVTLTKWIKKDGDWVDRDEVIAELESEKATFEINAEQQGILHTVAKENDTLKVGDVACTIDEKAAKPVAAEKISAPENKEQKHEAAIEPKDASSKKESSSQEKVTATHDQNKDLKATPVAAAILADKKVDLTKVTPTGSNGRITKHDVMDALSIPGRAIGKEL
ncbi:MAG: biotin/lipoyl-containing protein, partial [Ginsengibacter sp.]